VAGAGAADPRRAILVTMTRSPAAADPAATPELSIVMPCLDEAVTVGICIDKALTWARSAEVSLEIVVADNGSTDGSQRVAAERGARVVQVEERGYGGALMGGIAAARGRFVIMGDADDTYDFGNLSPFLERLRAGDDLVIGNRFAGGVEPGAMPPLNRYLGNPALTGVGRLLFRSPVGDFHCGLRGFARDAIMGLDLRTTGMEFASEMVVKATLQGLRIDEVPTKLSRSPSERRPHLRPWRDGWRHLRFLLLYSPRWLFLYPGLLLMIAGLLVGIWLIPGPRTIGGVTLDVQTLLFAALAMVVGFQSVQFALFSKVFAISEGLLPEDARLTRMFRYVTLETGLIVGALLVVVGAAGSIYAFTNWGVSADFGDLDPSESLRVTIPSVTAIALGAQVVLGSFFLSLLGLRRR
jgi:glycosyltransferase involved in cell wall biosynthesis